MQRRCRQCQHNTSREQVNFCPHCGASFTTPTHRPPRVPSSSARTSESVRRRPPSSSSFDRRPTEPRRSHSRERSSTECQYQTLCEEYLSSLNWDKRFFNRQHNHCYCPKCHSKSSADTFTTGGALYVVPRGWCRFGLHVDEVRAHTDQIWSQWVITYHGTSPIAAQSIVTHRQFLMPGDVAIDGSVIRIRPGHIKGKCQIYTSPTIAYSSLPMYCPTQQFRSKITNKLYEAYLVLQCRQKPNTFKVQGETIAAGQERLCPFIPNEQIEILTEIRAAVVPYGVLIQLTEVESSK